MIVLWVLGYVILVALVAALFFLPDFRSVVLARVAGGYRRLEMRRRERAQRKTTALLRRDYWWVGAGRGLRGLWARRKWWLVAGGMIVLLPPLLALVFYRLIGTGMEGYEELPTRQDAVIASLLQGEQLVPPPPLPPEVFTTREVELVRPDLASASRNWEQLDHDFEQRLLLVYKIMEERHGYKMALLEGYRSPERQAKLAAIGGHVTNAGAYQSYHQYGLAADSAFMREGKLVISERDPWAMRGYELYGEVAESVGLVWGGRWKMMDFGHVELRRAGVIRR